MSICTRCWFANGLPDEEHERCSHFGCGCWCVSPEALSVNEEDEA